MCVFTGFMLMYLHQLSSFGIYLWDVVGRRWSNLLGKEITDLQIFQNDVFLIYLMKADVLSVISSVQYHGSGADHSE